MNDLDQQIAELEARRAALLDDIALSGAIISSGVHFALGRVLLCAPTEQYQEVLRILASSLRPRRRANLREFLEARESAALVDRVVPPILTPKKQPKGKDTPPKDTTSAEKQTVR